MILNCQCYQTNIMTRTRTMKQISLVLPMAIKEIKMLNPTYQRLTIYHLIHFTRLQKNLDLPIILLLPVTLSSVQIIILASLSIFKESDRPEQLTHTPVSPLSFSLCFLLMSTSKHFHSHFIRQSAIHSFTHSANMKQALCQESFHVSSMQRLKKRETIFALKDLPVERGKRVHENLHCRAVGSTHPSFCERYPSSSN